MKIVKLEKLLQFNLHTDRFCIIFMMRKKCILLSGTAKIVHQIFTSNYHVNLFRCKSINHQNYFGFCKNVTYSESGLWKTWNNFDSSMKNDFWLKENCKLHTVRTWGKWLRNVFWAITSLLVVFPVTFFIVNMFYFIQKVNTLEWNSFWGSIEILHNRRQVFL